MLDSRKPSIFLENLWSSSHNRRVGLLIQNRKEKKKMVGISCGRCEMTRPITLAFTYSFIISNAYTQCLNCERNSWSVELFDGRRLTKFVT